MESLRRQLMRAPFPMRTAEGSAAASAYAELRARQRQQPWVAVRRRDAPERLIREVETRLARRQTGNDEAYRKLVEWYRGWARRPAYARRGGGEGSLGSLMVCSPFRRGMRSGSVCSKSGVCARWQRRSFVRGAFLKTALVHCATGSGGRSTRLRDGEVTVEVWFQRQKPLGQPRWQYESGSYLTGIPDVVVSATGHPPLVVMMRNTAR